MINAAFHYELIADGEAWLGMLEHRNLLAHTHAEERFNLAVKEIKEEYYSAITQVHRHLGEQQ